MFQLLDWYLAALGPLLFSTLECIAVMWIYGTKQMSRDVEMMTGKALSSPVKILLAFVIPAILMTVFILTLNNYQPPTYGNYEFPSYASTIGWCLAVISILPLPVYMVLAVRRHMAIHSLTKSVELALKPAKDWGPANATYTMNQRTEIPSLKANVMGMFR